MTAIPSTAPRRTRGNLLRALLAGVAVTALAPSFATLAIAEDARVKDMSLDVQTPYKAAIVKVSSSDGGKWDTILPGQVGFNAVMRVDLTSNPPVVVGEPIPVGSAPESMMLTPNERSLVVSLRGSPASLSFVDTLTLSAFPLVRIGPEDDSTGDLAVMTQNGHFVYATYDNNIPGTGGIAVVDVRTRELVDRWQYPTTGRPHGIWYSKKTPRNSVAGH